MNRLITIVILLFIAVGLGVAVERWWLAAPGVVDANQSADKRTVLYWQAPMDPGYRSDQPGKSPMGMELVPVYSDELAGDDPGLVKISPTVVSNLGVRTGTAERGTLQRLIETVGYVGYDEDTLRQVNTRVDGWIEKLSIKSTGDPVTRGQVLFELYSPTLVNAQEEYLAVLKSSNTALHEASRERLRALGVTAGEIERLDKERTVKQRIRIYSQTDGVVAQLGVREGVYITPATSVMSIAELDRIWVLAEVFERQSAWVQAGQRADVELDYLPGERWRGAVDYVYPEIDPKTRTLKVRVRFDNESEVLRPNMFARVKIFGKESPAVVHIPREALIPGGATNRVVVALDDGKFRAQAVTVGIESGDRVEIRTGLSGGERVVVSGQFLIDSESNIDSALSRMNEGTTDEKPMRATVSATIRGIDMAASKVTLQHEAVSEWSWPAMTMGFDVIDVKLLQGLDLGQSVDVTIERQADDNYVVSDIQPAAQDDHSGKNVPQNDAPAGHEGHGGENVQ